MVTRLVFFCVLGVTARVSAQTAQPPTASVPTTTSATPTSVALSDERAKAQFLQGQQAYDEGDYERAVDFFSESFQLSGRPQILFNLAAAYERLAAYHDAADALRRYLPDAPPQEATPLRLRIKRLAERDTALQLRALELARLQRADQARREVRREPKKRIAYALGGVAGTTLIATGVLFAMARQAHGEVATFCRDRLCTPASAAPRRREVGLLWGAGITGLIATASAGAAVWEWRRDEAQTVAATIWLSPKEAHVTLSHRF